VTTRSDIFSSTSRLGGGLYAINLQALACCAGLGLLSGCPQPCQGPGCGDAYTAATISILDGSAQQATGTLDARDTWAALTGLAEQGRDWAVLPAQGQLLVGVPAQGAVGSLVVEAPGSFTLIEAQGVIVADRVDDRLGASLDRLPGTADLLIGAPAARADLEGAEQGAVLLFEGLADGLDRRVAESEARLKVGSGQSGAAFGSEVRGCADIDGDGLPDWMAAAPRASAIDAMTGEVTLLPSSTWAEVDGTLVAEDIETRWRGTSIGARAGSALDCSQDLTGDGFADLVVGAPFEDGAGEATGAVYLVAGGVRLATGGSERQLSLAAAEAWFGNEDEDWFGRALATGDLDGDGVGDLAVGAPGANEGAGEVRAWLSAGRAGGTLRINGEAPGDGFGQALAIAYRDGDGLQDLLVGAPYRNPDPLGSNASFQAGTLYEFNGPPILEGWPILLGAGGADRSWTRAEQYLRTGQRFWVHDLNGDGVGELLLLHRTDPL